MEANCFFLEAEKKRLPNSIFEPLSILGLMTSSPGKKLFVENFICLLRKLLYKPEYSKEK